MFIDSKANDYGKVSVLWKTIDRNLVKSRVTVLVSFQLPVSSDETVTTFYLPV